MDMVPDTQSELGAAYKRLEGRKATPFVKKILVGATALSGAMLGMAVYNLTDGETALDVVKAGVMTFAGIIVSYGVSAQAIEKGAALAAINFPGAKLTSIASILAVGTGLFASTFAGLTINRVDELRLAQFGSQMAGYVDRQDQVVSKAGRTGPALKAVVADLQQKTACEKSSSCISLRGNGGRGTVTRMLEIKTARAEGILKEFEAGEAIRSGALSQISGLVSDYDTTLDNSDLSKKERRKELRKIVARIKRALNILKEALPVALLEAYAKELQEGVSITDRVVASQNLNAIFRNHGKALEDVIDSLEVKDKAAPIFPAKTGVSETFRYIGHFLPIAAIVAVLELILPITIWLYTYFTLYCRVDGITPSKLKEEDEELEGETGNAEPETPAPARRPRGRPRTRPDAKSEVAS